MKLAGFEIEHPLVLGPMAGVTDQAFRTVCARLGANITVTEMVSSRALVYKDKKSAALLNFTKLKKREKYFKKTLDKKRGG